MKRYTIDTNVLMRCKEKLESLDGEILIPAFVLEELDKLKSYDDQRGAQARAAVRYIKSIKDTVNLTLDVDDNIDLSCLPDTWDSSKYDNKIIAFAHNNKSTVVSQDYIVQLKAESLGLEVETLEDEKDLAQYTGVREIFVDGENDEILALHYQNENSNIFNLHTNEYLAVYDRNQPKINERGELEYKRLGKLQRWNGEEFVSLKLPRLNDTKPLNDLQECALDLLYNPDIPIKIVTGGYGSGKTLLTLRTALHMMQKEEKYGKILCIRNPDGDDESKDIGFLPGEKEDKLQPFFQPIADNMPQGEAELEKLVMIGQIECNIPRFVKGTSKSNTFIIVDEAEDLTKKTLKGLGTRVAGNSVICFSGDYKQAESRYKHNNGLLQLMEKTKDEPLVGCVMLREDVRSSASKVFANL